MAVKVIVEFTTKSGKRDELLGWIEGMMAGGPPMPGSLGAVFYKAVEDPDVVVEIADWESAQAREAVFEQIEVSGGFAPMLEFLAAPPRTTVLETSH